MRRQILFDDQWLFHEGDIDTPKSIKKSVMYTQAKTERKRYGPASRDYLDGTEFYGARGPISPEYWQVVDLPHDYIISQTPSAANNESLGFFRYDNAWYRKHFELEDLPEGTRVRLYFEGVAIHAKIYVNGVYMLTNNCGYNSFEVDITDVVDFGGPNVLAVYIDCSEHEGWWYEGAGIYRHVWLDISDPVSVDRYGVFVHPENTEGDLWRVPVETEVRNDGFTDAVVEVMTQAVHPNGYVAFEMQGELTVPARSHATLHQVSHVVTPFIWDVDDPKLYTLNTTLSVNGTVVDVQQTRFGFRTFRFDADEGFFLNGRHLKIKGLCCHQDYGLTGKVVPERVQRYKLELFKEMGCNGYRCSHYPQHAHTMDMLDELGFLVLDETRWYDSSPEGMQQLDMLIKRDRNHPSVIFWSIGNEEPFHLTEAGRRLAKSVLHRARQLDPSRPATTAVSHDPLYSTVMDEVDVMGVNYNWEQYDGLHERHPEKPLISTECCACGTTRGWYDADAPKRGYIRAYDHDINKSFVCREKTWKFFMARPWLAGGYQWDGVEHRGEALWPRLCSQSGAIDLFLIRKDAFYQNQSHWVDAPMVHLLPHWNWEGREGEPIAVWAYTNCDTLELFLNGALIGRREVEAYGHGEWQVPYAPGVLEVKGYRAGELVCSDRVETTGKPVALRLTLERDGIVADGKDVAIVTCDCVDEQGRHVPDAAPFVQFDSNALGTIVGTGSSVSDHVPVTSQDRQMYAGYISVLGRVGKESGQWRIYAKAQGLKTAMLTIDVQ